MLLSDTLLQQTRLHFPSFEAAQIKIAQIEKGGSERKFYRIQFSPEQSIVLLKYSDEKAENLRYVEIAQFLTSKGIRAPKIYFHDPAEGLVWLEDLGERDLWSYRAESWPTRRSLYEAALTEVAKLHQVSAKDAAAIRSNLAVQFDAALYLWEQRYFFENCLGRFFGIKDRDLYSLGNIPRLAEIAAQLASFPRVLVHRDFQSQNVIVKDGEAYLIDFQGMRPGLVEYDVASLLYDPYAQLSAPERNELAEFYQKRNAKEDTAFVEKLRLCAMQRLMQALGAYGYLGLARGNKAFLKYIPTALYSLGEVIAEIPGLYSLGEVLRQLN